MGLYAQNRNVNHYFMCRRVNRFFPQPQDTSLSNQESPLEENERQGSRRRFQAEPMHFSFLCLSQVHLVFFTKQNGNTA